MTNKYFVSMDGIKPAWGWAPGHVTLIFHVKKTNDPLSTGSLGMGFSIKEGVLTVLAPSKNNELKIFWNGSEIDAPVSRQLVKLFEQKFGVKHDGNIYHFSRIPIGFGLGASGAGSLSLSRALVNHYDIKKINPLDASQLAHVAEILNSTGLGDVIAQYHGGFERRVKEGAPGIGKVKKIKVSQEKVILAAYGAISTKQIITSPEHLEKINARSLDLLKQFDENPTIEVACNLARQFSTFIGLTTPRLEKLLQILDELNLSWHSPIMIGETLAVFPKDDDENTLERIFNVLKTMNPRAILPTSIFQ